jgi:CRP-like cAMP-binding protein
MAPYVEAAKPEVAALADQVVDDQQMDAIMPDSNQLYDSVSPMVREELRSYEEQTHVPSGAKLITYGVRSEHLIIIKVGSAEIFVPTARQSISMGMVGRGRVLYMRSIMSGVLPEIEAIALEKCAVGLIPAVKFLATVDRHPEIFFAIAKILSADLNMAEKLLQLYGSRAKHTSQRTGSRGTRQP